MDELKELFTCYTKFMGEDPDADVRRACDELLEMFDKYRGDRDTFVKALEIAGNYSNWKASSTDQKLYSVQVTTTQKQVWKIRADDPEDARKLAELAEVHGYPETVDDVDLDWGGAVVTEEPECSP